MQVVIVTGVSGSGKTTAVHALEDLGFYCVDNLPVQMIGRFLDLCGEAERRIERVAAVVDARALGFLAGARQEIERLRGAGRAIEVLFLEAEDDALLRRYSETRRRHPLARELVSASVPGANVAPGAAGENRALGAPGVLGAIRAERERLAELRAMADAVIDTSELNPHLLRRAIIGRYGAASARMAVTLLSFGFRHGTPREADIVLDVRYAPNPYFVDELRPLSGLEGKVRAYVLAHAGEPFERLVALLVDLLPEYEKEGKAYLTIALGCTGGRHRSVAMIEALAERVRAAGFEPAVLHRDLERSGAA